VFIWAGLKVIGRDRGIIRCGIANFAALVFAFLIGSLVTFTFLSPFGPLLFFVTYLYVLKVLLDVSFVEAVAATIVASLIVLAIGLAIALVFGTWMVFFIPRPQPLHF